MAIIGLQLCYITWCGGSLQQIKVMVNEGLTIMHSFHVNIFFFRVELQTTRTKQQLRKVMCNLSKNKKIKKSCQPNLAKEIIIIRRINHLHPYSDLVAPDSTIIILMLQCLCGFGWGAQLSLGLSFDALRRLSYPTDPQ